MDALSGSTLHPLIVKLESIAPVSGEERRAIVALLMTIRDIREDQDILRDQDRPSQCCVILGGLACRYKVLPGGKRQVHSFHIPGNIPEPAKPHLNIMDHNLGTLVPCKVGFIQHETVRDFIRFHPRIGDICDCRPHGLASGFTIPVKSRLL